jgi:hypothetical protein
VCRSSVRGVKVFYWGNCQSYVLCATTFSEVIQSQVSLTLNTRSVSPKVRVYLSNGTLLEIVEAADSHLRRLPSALLHGCCTGTRLAVEKPILDLSFTCKAAYFKSGAEGIRTPDLRRAKAAFSETSVLI